MEQSLEIVMNNLMGENGVVGAIACDANGLTLLSKGSCPSSASGYVTAIAKRAAQIGSNNNNDTPTITIETESNNILIRQTKGITLAVYKIQTV